jgi:hypothetical protein
MSPVRIANIPEYWIYILLSLEPWDVWKGDAPGRWVARGAPVPPPTSRGG